MTIEALLLSVAMAVAAGLVGCLAVMRQMALAADALSHVALPGGVALALHIHPLIGAVALLFFGGWCRPASVSQLRKHGTRSHYTYRSGRSWWAASESSRKVPMI